MLEQYGINHQVVAAQDFQDLSAKYDVILLPSGTSKQRIVYGPRPEAQRPGGVGWAAGVGEEGWKKLRAFVENGGTLLAIGTAVETARELLDLPIEKALPEAPPRFGPGAPDRGRQGARDAERRRSRVARRVQQPGAADAGAARSCRGSREPVLLPGFAAAKRVRSEPSCSVGHAGGVADLLRIAIRPTVCARDSALNRRSPRDIRGEHPAERLAAWRGVPEGSSQRRLVPRWQGIRGHLRQSD